MQKRKIIIVCGPTGVGKTDVSIELAKEFNAEIISFDSRQFFIETEIGTAKPDEYQLEQVVHHFVNTHHIWESFSAGHFAQTCTAFLNDDLNSKKNFILVGGSGMYIDALVNGLDNLPGEDAAIRLQLDELFALNGMEPLQNLLMKLDFEYYKKVDINNKQRVMRALEVCMSSGKTYTSFLLGKKAEFPFDPIFIGIDLERSVLYERINNRVDAMLAAGLQSECEQLIAYKNCHALKTVGYKEIFEFLEGNTSYSEAVNLIKQHTRNYAKRQLTWFRKNKNIKWFKPDEIKAIESYIVSRGF